MGKNNLSLAFSDLEGNVFDFPGIEPAFRTGKRFARVEESDLIKLPEGSYLFSLPNRYPVFYNHKNSDFNHITVDPDGEDMWAVSSFLASGYLRTYLPAFIKEDDAPNLSLWAYCGVVFKNNEFYVPALRIDDDPRSDPEIHQNHKELKRKTSEIMEIYPNNRLVKQLKKCSTEYNCLCSRNFFLNRYEAPIPTSPACNSRCIGCLSFQEEKSGIESSQYRLKFSPTPEEISEVILHHFSNVEKPIASFGQGCEGEPLLRSMDLVRAIGMVKEKNNKGTININTNGSKPGTVAKLIDAGLDSIRISLNSPTEKYYNNYYKPQHYSYNDVLKSIETALNCGIFVSLNLFFLPGFTDMKSEVDGLFNFLKKFPVNMIQTRNLNIDPDYYFDIIEYEESEPVGIKNLLNMIKKDFPNIRLGYYNPYIEKL